ncbi:MAG: hypothetical protein IPL53_03225 [Ignavibacteria bacterium]|nr:hypothetical protein [Ignavibacteria bacterium]
MPDVIIFIFVLLTGMKVAYLSGNVTDINNFDESVYLFRGTSVNPFIKSHTDGFLYYVWYKIISVFVNTNIDLFFLNYCILLVLPGLMLYLFLRVKNVNLFISFISSVLFIISSANILVFPLITKFALCVMLAGFIIIYRIKDPQKKLLSSVCLSSVLTYIRPEFFMTLILTSAVYLIFFVLRNRNVAGKKLNVSGFIPLIPIFLLILFFNPVSRQRANVAFTQQFTFEVSERENISGQTSGHVNEGRDTIGNNASTGNSMLEMIINKPILLFEHACYNLIRLYESSIDIFPFFLLQNKIQYSNIYLQIPVIVLIVLSMYYLFERIRNKSSGLFSLICFLFFIPPLISVLIFYPRLHYLIFLFALVLIYLSVEFSERINRFGYALRSGFTLPLTVVSGILILIFLPLRGDTKSIHEKDCTMLHTVRLLNEFEFKDTVNFFAAHPGYLAYMNRNWNYFTENIIEEDTYDFIYNKKINVILVDDYFLIHPLFRNDKIQDKLLNDEAFIKMNLTGCTSYLLIRKEIVK